MQLFDIPDPLEWRAAALIDFTNAITLFRPLAWPFRKAIRATTPASPWPTR